jgi:outer membrane protein OmpA-like peptidoglycan-associated protein
MKPGVIGIRTFLAISLLLGSVGAFAVDQAKDALFGPARSAFEAARSAQAEFFAPKSYEKATKYYRAAEQKFTANQDTEAVRADLAAAIAQFKKALSDSKEAKAMFASTLKARADAEKVQAASHADDLWRRAEDKFSRAISDYDRAAITSARQKGAQAEQLYRDAELATIKSTYLSKAELELAQAERDRVGRYAPKTLQKAKQLLMQAASALEKDRYDADVPRSLARQAQDEVSHARYLAEAVKQARADKSTTEDLILMGEKPLSRISAAADMKATFENGYEGPTKKIIGYIQAEQERAQKLEQDKNQLQAEISQLQARLANAADERAALTQRLEAQAKLRESLERQIASLQAETQQLHLNLGGVSEERGALADRLKRQTVLRENLEQEVGALKREIGVLEQMVTSLSAQRELLAKRLDAQTRVRDQAAQVEGMFARDQARVLRQADDVIIRLVGLQFDVGQSNIEPKNFELLAIVGKAIQMFPKSALTIEGHTDSYGGDGANLALSQKRADAVKQYLVSNLHIDPSRVHAVGYGETRPVANNETEEGRARNRRIDVVIRPRLSTK